MNEPKVKRFHRYWTQDEADFIRTNIETLDSTQMAAHLGRPKRSVKSYIGKVLKLTRSDAAKTLCSKANSANDRRLKWTSEELQYVRDSIQTLSCVEMAAHLGKSLLSVRTKANRDLGLKRTKEALLSIVMNTSAAVNLNDGFVASTLAPENREKQQALLWFPQLIELKRHQFTLNRLIANGKITRNTSGGPVAPDEGQDLPV